jgi:hypothetical protein
MNAAAALAAVDLAGSTRSPWRRRSTTSAASGVAGRSGASRAAPRWSTTTPTTRPRCTPPSRPPAPPAGACARCCSRTAGCAPRATGPALADAAALADEVLVLDVYAAGETAIAGVDVGRIVERCGPRDATPSATPSRAPTAYLRATLTEGDLVVTLGAGDVWRVAEGVSHGPAADGVGDARRLTARPAGAAVARLPLARADDPQGRRPGRGLDLRGRRGGGAGHGGAVPRPRRRLEPARRRRRRPRAGRAPGRAPTPTWTRWTAAPTCGSAPPPRCPGSCAGPNASACRGWRACSASRRSWAARSR